MSFQNGKKTLSFPLKGRIDSNNAAQVEAQIKERISAEAPSELVLDAEKLEYVSSAGLRVILRLRKQFPGLAVTGVSTEVYDIFEMTGFTEMIRVERAYRRVSVEGCEVIGEGFNGKVYRVDRDTVVKTYKNEDAIGEIRREREYARLALILGVPTAISYDIVRVGDSYGSVFELLNAKSFSEILAKEPERFDWCVRENVRMLKTLHSIKVPEGRLPSAKQDALRSFARIKDLLPEGLGEKLIRLTDQIPDSDRMIHGDLHTKNIVLADGEVLLIDMDTLSVGHPIFEFMHMYNAYVGFSESDGGVVMRFQGYDQKTARRFWHESLAGYLNTRDEDAIREVEDKVRCLSYADLVEWSSRHADYSPEAREHWMNGLIGLLRRLDTVCFEVGSADAEEDANTLKVEAVPENLQKVTDFVTERLEAAGCSFKARMQTELIVEEVFVNIASYAYSPGTGPAWVGVSIDEPSREAVMTFTDEGKPYDPTAQEDPDVTLSAEEREPGGLGIFLTKKLMDGMEYEYRDGRNVLTLRKKL